MVIIVNLGDFTFKEIVLPNLNVTDGAWHTIEFDRVLNDFEMMLDDGEYGNYMYYRGALGDAYNYLTLNGSLLSGAYATRARTRFVV